MVRIWFVAVVVFAGPRLARADEIRAARPLLVTTSVDVLETGANIPFPLIGARVAFEVADRLEVEVGGGAFGAPIAHCGGCGLISGHVGARWSFGDGALAPYGLAHLGVIREIGDSDTPGSTTTAFIAGGLGVEYASGSGLSVWGELGAGALDAGAFGFASLGIGYRFAMAR